VNRRLLLLLCLPALIALSLPIAALFGRVNWYSLPELALAADVRSALRLSLVVSLSAVALSLAGGLPLAWWLARGRSRLRPLARIVVTLPMVLPPVVAGVALLAAFGRSGPLGRALEAAGLAVPFTLAAAVLAATFVSAPLLVTALEAGLMRMEPRREQAAATLGAAPWRVFLHVNLPELRPALLGGVALCWARALGEFGATITFAGNLPGRSQTLPLAIYEKLYGAPEQAFALAALLILASAAGLLALRLRPESP
jgi:molybdate transport system permease protein